MFRFLKNRIFLILFFILFLSLFLYRFFSQTSSSKEEVLKQQAFFVDVIDLNSYKTKNIKTLCSIEPVTDIAVISELGAKVSSVSTKEGKNVKKGDLLFSLENTQQKISVQNARVSLNSAKLALSDLLEQNSNKSDSLLEQTKKTQSLNIESARNNFFNTNLKAYPENSDEDAFAPTISGNYTCEQEGKYIVEVYKSSSESGYSFRFSGLESGHASATTVYASALGDCGLEITFPDSISNKLTWIIPVPNTRSSKYFSTKKAYESALSGKDLNVNKVEASLQKIKQAKDRITQASLQLQLAQENLAKSYIKATESGVLSEFDIHKGDFVSSYSQVASIKSIDNLQIVAYVSAEEARNLHVGSTIYFNDTSSSVSTIAPTIENQTKKLKLVSYLDTTINTLVSGTEIACSLERDLSLKNEFVEEGEGQKIIPLSAISVLGTDYYVFYQDGDYARTNKVTPGAILGDSIVVYGLEHMNIIRDARGLRDGMLIHIN